MLIVLTGGTRSGKSRFAAELAVRSGAPVTFIATAEALDDEMAARIAAHRAERPAGWLTVEEPYRLDEALAAADPSHVVVLDCLTLWLANALERGDDAESVENAATRAAAVAGGRDELTVVVTNEVGLGVVPATPLGRSYRDLLGSVNRIWVDASDRALLMVAGRAIPLLDAHELAGR
jgi:adenosylcobinamide kinase / adenosylcobinamide-phosphate guanylyltransferase